MQRHHNLVPLVLGGAFVCRGLHVALSRRHVTLVSSRAAGLRAGPQIGNYHPFWGYVSKLLHGISQLSRNAVPC